MRSYIRGFPSNIRLLFLECIFVVIRTYEIFETSFTFTRTRYVLFVCVLAWYIWCRRIIAEKWSLSRISVANACKCRLLTARSAIRHDVYGTRSVRLRFLLSRSARAALRNWQWTLRRRCSHIIGSFGELETMKLQRAVKLRRARKMKGQWRGKRRTSYIKVLLHLSRYQPQADATLVATMIAKVGLTSNWCECDANFRDVSGMLGFSQWGLNFFSRALFGAPESKF